MKNHDAGAADRVLVIDVGNTSTSLGIYCRGRVGKPMRLASHDLSRASAQACLQAMLAGRPVDAAVLASVVPGQTPMWVHALRVAAKCRPVEVTHRLRLGVRIDYPAPETIGADRLANACAAAARYGAPVVVADFGTALTFDVLARGRGYVGGVIAPGLPLMLDYLAERTALLPRIKPARTRRTVGRSTRGAMQAGAHWGYLGMVREILCRLKQELGSGMTVCATGGYARWIMDSLDTPVQFAPHLTLEGLGRIHELNRPRDTKGSCK